MEITTYSVPARPRGRWLGFVLAASLPLAATSLTHAQGIYGARRTNEISPFIAFSGVTPSYFPDLATGLAVGLDLTSHLNRYLAPSLEIRGNRDSDSRLIERSVLFGPRLQATLRDRYHPYANFLIGGGTIIFLDPAVGYHEDRSKVYSYGGGLDVDLSRQFAAKIDFQGQSWNIGKQTPGGPDLTFSPRLLSVGLQYSIPFRPRPARTR